MIDKMSPKALVIVATYNGEKYIREQLESILNQKGVSVSVLVVDDRSTDHTVEICEQVFSNAENDCLIRINSENLGVAANFMLALYSAKDNFDYYAFSDQDDVWLPEKLSHAIRQFSNVQCASIPTLYYSDVTNTDARLRNGCGEYYQFSEVASDLKRLLVMNWASGCTMVMNLPLKKLIERYKPSSFPRIHDAWVHLIALTCGRVLPDLSNSYILRRITGDNQVGVRDLRSIHLCAMCKKMIAGPSDHGPTEVASQLLAGYGDSLSESDLAIVRNFIKMRSSVLARIRNALDPSYSLPTVEATIALKIRILLNRL